ncbi:MAG: peptide-methionine (S)-S-oxide reductase MsrA [Pseudobacteriovorax sp.]|nr:peptide-methionine (S)-S-oxide reductase MsrA [Pseudobacteriovorax sp.]
MNLATFGGGCFWCMEEPFANLDQVESVLPGYMGGHTAHPKYEDVCTGMTGHVEVVQVSFAKLEDYPLLLDYYWKNIDPTDSEGQFADKGTQYRPVIFYHDESQRQLAEASRDRINEIDNFAGRVAVSIEPAQEFYVAETVHCQYYAKNPEAYKRYKLGSGRAGFLDKAWR